MVSTDPLTIIDISPLIPVLHLSQLFLLRQGLMILELVVILGTNTQIIHAGSFNDTVRNITPWHN